LAEVSRTSGIVLQTHIMPSDVIAELVALGDPMDDEEPVPYSAGDLVYRSKYTNLHYEVEGEVLYIFDQKLIHGKCLKE
jgi:co-chaperonin GroES (HSP10)